MSKQWHNSKFAVYGLILIILSSVAVSGIFYKRQYDAKLGNAELLEMSYLYDFYKYANPDIADMPYYGSKNASITITAFLNMQSNASKLFMQEILPQIKKEYIDTGNAKYYYKSYITFQDINERNDNLKLAMAFLCIKKVSKGSYYNLHTGISSVNNAREIPMLLERYNLSSEKYITCMNDEKANLNQLSKDAFEIESLGMVGINQRVYIGITGRDNTVLDGIPAYTKFKKAIRQYEIQVGN